MDSPDSPYLPDEKRHIYSEGILYSETGPESIWGRENPLTLQALQDALSRGGKTWLNLAAGDGRYNNEIAKSADKVVATDIDPSALRKLLRNTPNTLRNKVKVIQMNLAEKFPLETDTIEGVFSAGTLHLFPKPVFDNIASEISRVVRVGGIMVLEFRVDIKRTNAQTSKPIKFGDEPLYNHGEAIDAITETFPGFSLKFLNGDDVKETFDKANPPFNFSCLNLIVIGKKEGRLDQK